MALNGVGLHVAMDAEIDIKPEIKEEEDITITELMLPPVTLDGPPTIWELKEEDEDLTLLSYLEVVETDETFENQPLQESSLSMGRPRRGQHPKRFHDELYNDPPKRLKVSDKLLSSEIVNHHDYAKESRTWHVGETYPLFQNETIYESTTTQNSCINNIRHTKLPTKNKITERGVDKYNVTISSSNGHIFQPKERHTVPARSTLYKRHIPDDFYKAKFKLKPCYVAIHNLVQLTQNGLTKVININIGGCRTCEFLQSKKGYFRGTEMVKMLEITCQPIEQSSHISAIINVNGEIFDYVLSQRSYTHFIREINLRLKRNLPTKVKSPIKLRLPHDFEWKECLPECAYVTPALRNNIIQTFTCAENEVVVKTPVQTCLNPKKPGLITLSSNASMNSEDTPNEEEANKKNENNKEMIFKVNKLRCCIHCSQVFRNEQTHHCPGQVLLVLPPIFPKTSSLAQTNTLPKSHPIPQIKPSPKFELQTSSPPLETVEVNNGPQKRMHKCVHCSVSFRKGDPHVCLKTNENNFCNVCKKIYKGDDHQCSNNVTKCNVCFDKLISGVQHVCKEKNKISYCRICKQKKECNHECPSHEKCKLCFENLIFGAKHVCNKDNIQLYCKNCKMHYKGHHRCQTCGKCFKKIIKGVSHVCKRNTKIIYCKICKSNFKGYHQCPNEDPKCKVCNEKLIGGVQHSCTKISLYSYCVICKEKYQGIHQCPNDDSNCKSCFEKLIPGVLHICPIQIVDSTITSQSYNSNSFEELYCCLICTKSYKYESSVKNHTCVPKDAKACPKCLQSTNDNVNHICPGFAKCPKCITVVQPDDLTCHKCRIFKYCCYCDSVLHGTSSDCTVTECRILNKCKVCDDMINENDNHQCKNLIKCNKCDILYSQTANHICNDQNTKPYELKCKKCNGTLYDKIKHVCREKCYQCNSLYDANVTHVCSAYKTCEFCNNTYNTNNIHKCTANMCKFCNSIVLFDDISTHKCYLENVTCLFCKLTIPKNEKDTHKCAPKSRCTTCKLPITADSNHSCKRCPFCKAIFNKTHICFAKSGKSGSKQVVTTEPEILKKPEEKSEVLSKHIYNCSSCKMTTKLKTEFLKHSCVKKVDEVFLCNGCPKMFSKLEFLEKHQQTMCPKRNNESNETLTEEKEKKETRAEKKSNIESVKISETKIEKLKTKPNKITSITVNQKTDSDELKKNSDELKLKIESADLVKPVENVEVHSNCSNEIASNLNDSETQQLLSLPTLIDGNIQFDDVIEEVSTMSWEEINL